MYSNPRLLAICFFVLGCNFMIGWESLGFAQSSDTKRKVPTSTKQPNAGQITVKETFEPSFQIEPLSHKIEGRPSEVIPFKFTVTSANSPSEIEVSAIGLRQELSGMILHDPKSSQADLITLVTPSKMKLEPNKPYSVEGVVRIPKSDARFHSIGIMVRDIGRGKDLAPKIGPDGQPETQAGVKFMTQYVLRLDLSVIGARGELGRELQIDNLGLVPFEGRPRLQAIVSNPADTTFEFELRAKVRGAASDRSAKAMRMTMPIRSNVEDESRYSGRILPKSKIRMEELLPEAIASGQYEADLEILCEDRVVMKKTIPFSANAADYPAQEVLISQVGEDLQVSPAQIELSQVRGGSRRLTMVFKNSGREPKTIELKAMTSDDLELTGVLLQPATIQLAPGASRKTSITMKSQSASGDSSQFGYLQVLAKTEKRDFTESKRLPLALVLKRGAPAQVSIAPLQWDNTGEYPGFRTKVENSGTSHFPLEARLSIFDSSGRRINVPAGFGKWVMPGNSAPVLFRMEQPLAPGDYILRCEVQTEDKPVSIQQNFTVTDLDNAVPSK